MIRAILALAVLPAAAASDPLVVRNNLGGDVRSRIVQIEALDDRQVEIRGRYCYSTCTMFLGAKNVCIEPQVVFGFHGPKVVPHDDAVWDLASRTIASYYPFSVRGWYLRSGRYAGAKMYRIRGEQLILQGIPECDPKNLK